MMAATMDYTQQMQNLPAFVHWLTQRHQRCGGVTEIRVVHEDKRVWCGYFDADHQKELIEDIRPIERPKIPYGEHARCGEAGIYLSMQAVHPDLLARSANRIKQAKIMTSDADISAYCLFAVDVDPIRRSGISATTDEKRAAYEVTERVRAWFAEHNINCIQADSGNGYYLIIPTVTYTSEAVPTACAKAQILLSLLAQKFNAEGAEIDTSIYNASRLLRCFGTKNCKGDSTDQRPHRWSTINLSNVPPDIDLFAMLQGELDAFATEQARITQESRPAQQPTAAHHTPTWSRSDSINVLECVLQAEGLRFRRKAKSGREVFEFEECPVHTDDDGHHYECCVMVGADGKYGARCQHDDKLHWREFKAAIHWDQHAEATKESLGLTQKKNRSAGSPQHLNELAEPACAATFHLTDAGNAERFAMEYTPYLRYVPELDKWIAYDGTRWNAETGDARAVQLGIKMARTMMEQAVRTEETDARERLAKHALKSEGAARVQAMLSLAKNLPSLIMHARALDQDPYLLNVPNGTINLRTGTLRPHNPADMLTKIGPVEYDPGARSEIWESHLKRVTGGKTDLSEFIQVAAGYSATGDTREEVLFLVHGPTAGGKTTTIEALKAALGDYGQTADFETFLKRNQVGGIRNDIARLVGARLVISVEVDEGKQLAEGLVKMLTGGDTVSARFLHHEFFEFKPACKLWLVCNDAPRASDTDDALWRRIIRIPFEYTIPKAERDPQVKVTLKDPAIGGPAVLAWIVQGCTKWRSTGLIVPSSIEQATQAYRESQDPLREFFDDKCVFDPRAWVPVKTLRVAYEAYAQEVGIRFLLGPREFNRRLEARECRGGLRDYQNEVGTIRRTKCWVGIRMRIADDESLESSPTQPEDGQFDEFLPI